MRIPWFSNSPHCPSGYGTQTRLVVPRLKHLGHEMCILASHGLSFGSIALDGIPVFPSSPWTEWSQDLVGPYTERMGGDITILFLDAWILEPSWYGEKVRPVMYFPVDHDPLPRKVQQKISQAWARIVYSQFGLEVVKKAGMDAYYIPHGVDVSAFSPMDKMEARKKILLPEDDRLIFGVVAANHDPLPSRKGWAELFEAYKIFREKHPKGKDSSLYLHTTSHMRLNLDSLAAEFGLNGQSVFICDQIQNVMGFDTQWMRATMNAIDCLVVASTGEGCCLPALEAQSCETPVICGDWTATPEFVFGGIKIPKDAGRNRRYMTGQESYQWLVDPEVLYGAMCDFADSDEDQRKVWGKLGRTGALQYEIDTVVTRHWKPVMEELQGKVEEENKERNRERMARVQPAEYTIKELTAAKDSPPDIILVAPSWGEKCGIAEYTGFTRYELVKAGYKVQIVETVHAAYTICQEVPGVRSVVVEHEYSFWDNRSDRLGRGETTNGILTQLGKLRKELPNIEVSILVHTVSPKVFEKAINAALQKAQEDHGIRIITTSFKGADFLGGEFIPLGTWEIPGWTPIPNSRLKPDTPLERLTVGNFGMYGSQRDIPAHLEVCRRTNSVFLGSFYTPSHIHREELERMVKHFGVECQLWTDYGTDIQILQRLSLADVLYMPRPDVGLFYASSSIIVGMNALRPVIVNRGVCYSDLGESVLYADTPEEAVEVLESLKDPAVYTAQVEKMGNYLTSRNIARVWEEYHVVR